MSTSTTAQCVPPDHPPSPPSNALRLFERLRGAGGDIGERDRAHWHAAHGHLAVCELEVARLASRRSAETSRIRFARAPGRVERGAARHRRRPAAARAEPHRRAVGVTCDDSDLLERHTDLVGRDLRERRLVALPVGHLRGEDRHHAVGLEPHPHLLGSHDPAATALLAWAGRGFDVRGDAESRGIGPRRRAAFWRARNDGRSMIAAMRSSDSRVVTPTRLRPVIIVSGGSPRVTTLRSRSSIGSMPTSWATMSSRRSR